jgi:hypothetical protein
MKLTIVKRQIILSLVVLMLIGLSSQARAQNNTQHIELLSYSFGIIQGQTGRITLTLRRLANPRLADEPIIVRFQLLDTEGEVIAQSSEIRIRPGQTRSWDQPRAALPESTEAGGRLQVRASVLVTTQSSAVERSSLMPTIEVIDSITGGTVYQMGKRFLIFVPGPNGTPRN